MRPEGRTMRISSIRAKGIVAEMLDNLSVSSPPTCSAQARAPNQAKMSFSQ